MFHVVLVGQYNARRGKENNSLFSGIFTFVRCCHHYVSGSKYNN